MHRLRALLKRCIAYGLYWSGFLWLYRRVALRDRAIVLMYHRVLPPAADSFSSPGIVVSPEIFAANMGFLRKHFAPLSAGQFQSCLDRGRFPDGACLVTFDDGWQDNEKYALPILERMQIPAVLFVATGFVGTNNTFWQERLTRQLFELWRDPGVGRSTLSELGMHDAFVANEYEHARHRIRAFVDRLKLLTTVEIERVAATVSTAYLKISCVDSGLGDDQFLDWNALNRMASTGLVTIGSHAHSHVPLPRLGRDRAIEDIQRSISEFERHGIPVPWMFAFPNGDYDLPSLDFLGHAGLTVGFTTERGYVKSGDDPRRLPRVNIHSAATPTSPEFLCRILGIF